MEEEKIIIMVSSLDRVWMEEHPKMKMCFKEDIIMKA